MQIDEFLILPIAPFIVLIPCVAITQKKARFLQRPCQAARTTAMHPQYCHNARRLPVWPLVYRLPPHLSASNKRNYTILTHNPYT